MHHSVGNVGTVPANRLLPPTTTTTTSATHFLPAVGLPIRLMRTFPKASGFRRGLFPFGTPKPVDKRT